jgi:hypothetical protein
MVDGIVIIYLVLCFLWGLYAMYCQTLVSAGLLKGIFIVFPVNFILFPLTLIIAVVRKQFHWQLDTHI